MPRTAEILAAAGPHAHRLGSRCWALRVDSGMAVGDELAPSRVWVDGEVTDEMLSGTSAIKIGFDPRPDLVERALKTASCYLGDQIALVAGRILEEGVDEYEIIIESPAVIAVWPHTPEEE